MRLRLILLLYNAALPLVLLVLLPASLLKMKKRGGYGAKFWQRFGFFDAATIKKLTHGAGENSWLHAVSVGEVNVARKLIAQIRKRDPHRSIVLSVTTSTGYGVALKDLPDRVVVIYSPVDLPFIVRRVFRAIQPAQLILVEAEIWPNLVYHARTKIVPVTLVNARLSPRSERRYRAFLGVVAPVFGMLGKVCVQDESDIPRWQSLGVAPARIVYTGSIKYDLMGSAARPTHVAEFRSILERLYGLPLPRFVLAASTHGGEERALALTIRSAVPDFPILMVPRHFERCAEVRVALVELGLRVALRSAMEGGPAAPDVVLIDSTGELRDWQSLAEIVVVGKSFLSHGGQNPAEAIAAEVPVICGPNMDNFRPLMDLLLKAEGITQVQSLEALGQTLTQFGSEPLIYKEMARRGRRALEMHRGATVKTVEEIDSSGS